MSLRFFGGTLLFPHLLADEHGSADGDEHNTGGDENDTQTGAAEKQGG